MSQRTARLSEEDMDTAATATTVSNDQEHQHEHEHQHELEELASPPAAGRHVRPRSMSSTRDEAQQEKEDGRPTTDHKRTRIRRPSSSSSDDEDVEQEQRQQLGEEQQPNQGETTMTQLPVEQPDTPETRMTNFLSWARDMAGGVFDKIELRTTGPEGDRGFFATCDLAPGDELASMPIATIISEQLASRSPVGMAMLSSPMLKRRGVTPIPGRTLICAYLIANRGKLDSPFYHYINILPQTYSDPLWWNDAELDHLDGTNIGGYIQERRNQVRNQFLNVFPVLSREQPALFPKDVFTYEAYLWAFSTCSSRAFPLRVTVNPTTGVESHAIGNPMKEPCVECLLPLLDMMNHQFGASITWFTDETSVRFFTGAKVRKGEQVYNNYGPKSNEELLMGYGFCLPNNEADHVKIQLTVGNDPDGEAKLAILRWHGLSLTHFLHNRSVPVELFSALRVLVMTPAEICMYSTPQQADLTDRVSLANETRMLRTLSTLLLTRLVQLGGESRDGFDRGLLLQPSLDYHVRLALTYRVGQRSILLACSNLIAWRTARNIESVSKAAETDGYLVRQDPLRTEVDAVAAMAVVQLRERTQPPFHYTLAIPQNGIGAIAQHGFSQLLLASSACITRASIRASRLLPGLDHVDGLEPDVEIALYLLAERMRNSESPFSRFILAVEFHSSELTPFLSCKPDSAILARASSGARRIFDPVLRPSRDYDELYDELFPALFQIDGMSDLESGFTRELFRWAMMVVGSLAIDLPLHPGSPAETILPPLLLKPRHSHLACTAFESRSFCVALNGPAATSSHELYLNYNDNDHLALLARHGLVLSSTIANPTDTVAVPISYLFDAAASEIAAARQRVASGKTAYPPTLFCDDWQDAPDSGWDATTEDDEDAEENSAAAEADEATPAGGAENLHSVLRRLPKYISDTLAAFGFDPAQTSLVLGREYGASGARFATSPVAIPLKLKQLAVLLCLSRIQCSYLREQFAEASTTYRQQRSSDAVCFELGSSANPLMLNGVPVGFRDHSPSDPGYGQAASLQTTACKNEVAQPESSTLAMSMQMDEDSFVLAPGASALSPSDLNGGAAASAEALPTTTISFTSVSSRDEENPPHLCPHAFLAAVPIPGYLKRLGARALQVALARIHTDLAGSLQLLDELAIEQGWSTVCKTTIQTILRGRLEIVRDAEAQLSA
ncbi:hypothetical protein CAOG_00643 [Capsaspora owczarzaki ATCC 30864]|uniref:SET domain-containing protein n=1 Tax=Capsaspora owczarzaki (strain ATCC 30864) TaxID=595528 RepID=A0A0D2WHK0_CAPO3|nr:hypothetical protein CAOG_00643 [Capsaspora owczarzaki ATCC 30864]KJE89095.1 hypothetical protein CAOG_000643 [Capsaspora owczarzaki ATCC 30864]|eukprot:XP_004365514.1 hypothetical protein CAOG_00643 [Capsaspora owczarzaki ATCC 30864]